MRSRFPAPPPYSSLSSCRAIWAIRASLTSNFSSDFSPAAAATAAAAPSADAIFTRVSSASSIADGEIIRAMPAKAVSFLAASASSATSETRRVIRSFAYLSSTLSFFTCDRKGGAKNQISAESSAELQSIIEWRSRW